MGAEDMMWWKVERVLGVVRTLLRCLVLMRRVDAADRMMMISRLMPGIVIRRAAEHAALGGQNVE